MYIITVVHFVHFLDHCFQFTVPTNHTILDRNEC